MPRLRPRMLFGLAVLLGAGLAGAFAPMASASHAEQKWAGYWHFTHLNSPNPGLTGGFALQHRPDDEGENLLDLIGGIACAEPTDYFVGGYTVPDTEDLAPDQSYNDTGKIRGCTVGDRLHLRGRYQSNQDPSVAGDIDLVLSESDVERWNGTFTVDGDTETYSWTGYFQGHFDDGADVPSDPPYPADPGPEPEPGPSPPPGTGPVATDMCNGREATITPNPGAPAGLAISGTASDDVIVGTDGPDRILGLGGNDTICGFGGDDEIVGGDGEDYVEAGLGNDIVNGDAGEDSLSGDYPDHNLLSPTGGNDQVFGGDAVDDIQGGPGNDMLFGGEGNDTLDGNIYQGVGHSNSESALTGQDNDKMQGEGGSDTLRGGRGNDTVDGGSDDDFLYGGTGSDVMNGRDGSDRLDAGLGNDRLDGGDGGEHKINDLFGDSARYFEIEAGVNINLTSGRVSGGQGRDTIRNIESVQASDRDDVIRGSSGPDILSGGLGDDDIYGLGGSDTLFGGPHDDRLIGGPGPDLAFGSLGFDVCAAERRSGCERLLVGAGK